MASVKSSNPEETSGSASTPISNLTFPLNEQLTNRCVIRFVEYERWFPGSKGTDKTTAIINLPLPTTVPDQIQLKFGGIDTDFLMNNYQNIKDNLSGHSFGDLMKQGSSAFTDISKKDLVRAFALGGESLVGLIPGGSTLANSGAIGAAGLIGGVVKNPHTTSVFDGVSNRVFNFTWRFSPRSEAESIAVNNIINTIKMRILPEESFKGYALDFPDLAYIDFEGDVKEYLPKIYRSFITNINVSNTNGDVLALYKSGAPVNIELNATFAETNIVTRKTLRNGTP